MNAVGLHRKLEENTGLLIFGILFVSAIGGLVQVLPSIFQESLSTPSATTKPYGAVELVGRDIYIREACGVCHTQQVRPLLAEVKRYGPYSRANESVYDRPFRWGTKRTGPDLQRIGAKYSDDWHRIHLIDPRTVVSNSIMPAYPWLAERNANADGDIQKKLTVLRQLGHPYTDAESEAAPGGLENVLEIEALSAKWQMLGTESMQGGKH